MTKVAVRSPVPSLSSLAAVRASFVGACARGGGDDKRSLPSEPNTETTTTSTSAEQSALQWDRCGQLECATLEVPRDYADPGGPTIDLALARRRADGDAIGSLLVNPGGPGAPGTSLVASVGSFFPTGVLEHFDIVGWDPRGTGHSASVDCTDDLDFFFGVDHSPDDPAEVDAQLEAGRELADDCKNARDSELLPYLASSATVDDMDSIRAALGEDQISYLGFSYGTYIGALYADKYPERVRAMVLDGPVDPSLGFEELARDQGVGFDSALNAFLDDCARNDCGFGGDDPHGAFTRLMAQIEAESLPGEVDGESRTLGPGEADIGVAEALYGGVPAWPDLARALNDAARGDGSRLLALSDGYTERQTGGDYEQHARGVLRHQLPRRSRADPRGVPGDGGTRARRQRRCSAGRPYGSVCRARTGRCPPPARPRRSRRRGRRRSWSSARRTIRPRR